VSRSLRVSHTSRRSNIWKLTGPGGDRLRSGFFRSLNLPRNSSLH
jgi:hypothetical protein